LAQVLYWHIVSAIHWGLKFHQMRRFFRWEEENFQNLNHVVQMSSENRHVGLLFSPAQKSPLFCGNCYKNIYQERDY